MLSNKNNAKTKRLTRRIPVKDLFIGGGGRVVIQSMTSTRASDVGATVAQIKKLEAAGCDLARVAVTDEADARAVREIVGKIKIPLAADIQFDYRLAIAAAENGAHKLRINPGNIGGGEKVRAVCDAAAARGIPIRVGINGGSLEKDVFAEYGDTPKALCVSALRAARLLEGFGFYDIVISVKSSSVRSMIEANRLIAAETNYPLHLGVTEAGSPKSGVIKSAIGIGALLADGIGDTIRVSLTGDPVREIEAARGILRALGLDKNYAEVISCPTCGRCRIDLAALVDTVEEMTKTVTRPLKLAVMGCAVNGPGEAAGADLGIAGGPGKSALFKKGKILRTVDNEVLFAEFIEELAKLL
ncbi:MAG: flavodoxin-dependent (E)-4-hydroxy-3-methylbut-2-enyl-diphosphate synthase [Clostridiales bacterium]|jgi:(E)-4-hydroxy-3-methylbut-2-enyl-diphosphate synthase|nr:flavodoxin-dependent (E)-4-hydroxy-3-methylbut-2-enyl-diphosphate synthase [Clostridiales bacterium]